MSKFIFIVGIWFKLETFIYHRMHILARLMTPSARLYFWRTIAGPEVDFILEHERRLLAIEVKLTNTL